MVFINSKTKKNVKKNVKQIRVGAVFVLLISALILLAVNASAATELRLVELQLKDITSNAVVDDVIVSVSVDNTITTQYLEKGKTIKLSLAPDSYVIRVFVDNPGTAGKDYYGIKTLKVGSDINDVFYIAPAGSLKGIVKDKLNNLVKRARLKIECIQDVAGFPEISDEFGSFSADYVPAGTCTISAEHNNAVGSTEIQVEKGSMNDIEVLLDETIVSDDAQTREYVLFLQISLGILIAIILLFVFRKHLFAVLSKKDEHGRLKNKSGHHTRVVLGKRAKDIMDTLRDREKEITQYIARNGGETTQAKIYNDTGIPKVTLFRYVRALELKKVIEVKKIGKVKKIRFTDWFLGQEEKQQGSEERKQEEQ